MELFSNHYSPPKQQNHDNISQIVMRVHRCADQQASSVEEAIREANRQSVLMKFDTGEKSA